jgi:flagellar motor switch/type III secretory pathway protein FliN
MEERGSGMAVDEASEEPGGPDPALYPGLASAFSQGDRPSGGLDSGGPVVDAAVRCAPLLEEVIRQFWGVSVRATFLTVSDQAHYYWRMDDFYVSQLQLAPVTEARPEPAMALLRLSDTTCDTLLGQVLGAREPAQPFDFRRISPLEASILSEFSRDVFACLRKQMMRKIPASAVPTQVTHLVWIIRPDKGKTGKLILSLPAEALRQASSPVAPGSPLRLSGEEPLSPDGQPGTPTEVPDAFFFHVRMPVRLYLGMGRMSLIDMNQLEADDIVVLEQSRTDRMFLLVPRSGERLPFGTSPEEIRRHIPFQNPYPQEPSSMSIPSQSSSVRQRLWDNLMIDVSAEFEPVKLPLKHLKQMSEGLIVEMGDLLHNKVCLQVEGKTLAWGELMIVGDRFAVRIREVVADGGEDSDTENFPIVDEKPSTEAVAPESHPSPPAPVAPETPPASPDGEESESSPDDFLNDDFDETINANKPDEF